MSAVDRGGGICCNGRVLRGLGLSVTRIYRNIVFLHKAIMKKIQLTGLALATLAACAPAWAQSTVTIYGAVDAAVGKDVQVIDSQIQSGKIGLQSSSRVNLQDSYLGFKGVEDLGGGVKVGFQLEQKLDASNGVADPEGAFARTSNIWLGGSWGRLMLGRSTTPSYNAMAFWDLMGAGNQSIANKSFGSVGFNNLKRQSNQVSYRTPQIGGIVLEAAYVPKDENQFAGLNRSKVDLGATYVAGPLVVGAAYNKTSGLDANFALGAKYQYQNIEFASAYYQSRNGAFYQDGTLRLVPNAVAEVNGVTLGVKATWNNFSAGLDVARETKDEYVVGGVRFDNNKKYTHAVVSGVYSLSKRTQAYVNYVRWVGVNSYGIGLSHSF